MSALTLDQAKAHLAIPDDKYDADLTAIIASAEAVLCKRVGPLSSTAVTRRIAGGTWTLALPITPAISLTSLTPRTGTALTLSDLYLDTTTGVVTFNNLTPFVAAYYDVVYNAGRATCPADLLLAVKELVRHLWETRRGNRAAASEGGATARSVGTAVPGVAYLLPYRVTELIAPHIQSVAG